MATFPLPPIAEGSAIPGTESIADRYFAPEINKVITALNALAADVATLKSPGAALASVELTAEQAQGLAGLPSGSTIVLITPTDVIATGVIS